MYSQFMMHGQKNIKFGGYDAVQSGINIPDVSEIYPAFIL